MSKIESGNVGLSEDAFCLKVVENITYQTGYGHGQNHPFKDIDHHAVYGTVGSNRYSLICCPTP